MQEVKEGAAVIRIGRGVFYNPKMEKLRDVSVIFLKSMSLKKAKLLDATAATGVRGIRYALEAGIGDVTMLDINKSAYRNARSNAKANGTKARVVGKSLQEFSGSAKEAFDVIDLDPFGSPAPLIYDALKLSKDGTVLMATATDTATLCGAEGSACLRIYGSAPMHNELCHEASVRILLNFLAREAAQFNFGIEPMMSIADMHYVRLFVVLRRGAKEATESVKASGFVSYCSKCHSFAFEKGLVPRLGAKCRNCGAEGHAYGPMWLGHLKNEKLVHKMKTIAERYSRATAEFVGGADAELDTPFFYSIPKLTSSLKVGSVPISGVISAMGKKRRVSRTAFDKDSLKTDAGIKEVTDAVRRARKISKR